MMEILEEMKAKGIAGAVIRSDGVAVATTIALKDVDANLIKLVASTAESMMQKSDDQAREMEIAFNGLIMVMVPIKDHVFCGLVQNRDDKKTVIEYAKKAGSL